jgi:hypothetical protein
MDATGSSATGHRPPIFFRPLLAAVNSPRWITLRGIGFPPLSWTPRLVWCLKQVADIGRYSWYQNISRISRVMIYVANLEAEIPLNLRSKGKHSPQARCWIEDIGLQLRKRHWKKQWDDMARPWPLQPVLSDREIWWTSDGHWDHYGDLSLAFHAFLCWDSWSNNWHAFRSSAPSTDLYGPYSSRMSSDHLSHLRWRSPQAFSVRRRAPFEWHCYSLLFHPFNLIILTYIKGCRPCRRPRKKLFGASNLEAFDLFPMYIVVKYIW